LQNQNQEILILGKGIQKSNVVKFKVFLFLLTLQCKL
jgi:hypothetical protein